MKQELCYLCDRPITSGYWLDIKVNKIDTSVYVCRECYKERSNDRDSKV